MTRKAAEPCFFLICAFFLSCFTCTPAALANDWDSAVSKLSLDHFRAGAVAVVEENDRGNGFAASLDWNPEWDFAPGWNFGMNLGAFLFNSLAPNNSAALEYQLTVGGMFYSSAWFELGGGAQSFLNGGNTAPLISGTFYFRFPDVILAVLDRAYVTYSAFLVPGLYTNELKLGFGITF